MRRHTIVLVLLSCSLMSKADSKGSNKTQAEGAASSTCTYKIKQDDTLNNVAAIYRVDLSTITELNPTVDAGGLVVGQEISVPCGLEVCSQKVKSGDTFATIGAAFGVDGSEIQALNPSISPVQLRVNMDVNVPCNALPSDCIHTLEAGDTVAVIAADRGIDVESILELNAGVDPAALAVGAVLKMPCNGTAGADDAEESCTFTVTPGVTFAGVAQAWGVDVGTIQALNPSVDATELQVKQVLSVPCTTPKSCPYIIKAGDSLDSISKATNTDLKNLTAWNAGVKLIVGQSLWAACPCHHTVEGGDTVLKIATSVGSSDAAILALNEGLDPKALQIGQVLVVPCTSSSTKNSTSSSTKNSTSTSTEDSGSHQSPSLGSTSSVNRRRLLLY